jgi:glycerol uptake facilitator-like aquaporin
MKSLNASSGPPRRQRSVIRSVATLHGGAHGKDWLKNAIVEFVSTFALIFVGAGSIIATGGKDLVAIALAHGLAIGLMVAAAGHISGGVYNPSLTVALVVARKIGLSRGVWISLSAVG